MSVATGETQLTAENTSVQKISVPLDTDPVVAVLEYSEVYNEPVVLATITPAKETTPIFLDIVARPEYQGFDASDFLFFRYDLFREKDNTRICTQDYYCRDDIGRSLGQSEFPHTIQFFLHQFEDVLKVRVQLLMNSKRSDCTREIHFTASNTNINYIYTGALADKPVSFSW